MTKEKKDGGGTARQQPDAPARQRQGSTQSMLNQSAAIQRRSNSKSGPASVGGLGNSVGQNALDRDDERTGPPSQRPSAGTADLPRDGAVGGDIERGEASNDSLVNDPGGAFKERP